MTLRTKHIIFSLLLSLALSLFLSLIGVPFFVSIAILAALFIFVPDLTWMQWNRKFWGYIDPVIAKIKRQFKR